MSYHIPFPKNFLAVNTPVKKSTPATEPISSPEVVEAPHGFLSNRQVPRHQSISSISSTQSESTASPPSSPASKAAESPVLGAKIFAPLPVNTKHSLPPASLGDMTPVARSAFLSNRRPGF